MLQFKPDPEHDLKKEWSDEKLRGELRFIVLAACAFSELTFKRPLTVSSIHRTIEENAQLNSQSLTHPDWRAVDCSAAGWKQEDIDAVAAFINGAVSTGFDTMPICYAAPHGTGPHFHFQVARMKPQWK